MEKIVISNVEVNGKTVLETNIAKGTTADEIIYGIISLIEILAENEELGTKFKTQEDVDNFFDKLKSRFKEE